jgi:hypothetical protein
MNVLNDKLEPLLVSIIHRIPVKWKMLSQVWEKASGLLSIRGTCHVAIPAARTKGMTGKRARERREWEVGAGADEDRWAAESCSTK